MMKETLTRRLLRLMFKVMAYRPPFVEVPPQGVVLKNVTVVNPGRERQSKQTVVVEGNRIACISASESQNSAGSGDGHYAEAYILPGLIDMHVHIPPSERELAGLLFLTYGVTTVRETGDADGTTWRARQRILNGKVPGPRIFASGPVLDGDPPFLPTSWMVRNATEAQDAVATLAAQGADFIKIHHKLSVEALVGIREAAMERGLRVVGHIPVSVPFEEARIWDVQHLDGMVPYPQPPDGVIDFHKNWRDLDSARIDFYVQTSVEQGLVHTPTIVSSVAFAHLDGPERQNDPVARLLPRYYRAVAWNRQSAIPAFRTFPDKAFEIMRQGLGRIKEVVGSLYRAGVRIHLGTDTAGAPFVVPGASLHEELGHIVDAGLTTEEAWMAATRNSGESLGVPLLGTVQKGAPANLLIFGEDPTRDLAALSTLKGVVAQGRLYPKTFLDKVLSHHRKRFERPLYDTLTTTLIRLALRRMVS